MMQQITKFKSKLAMFGLTMLTGLTLSLGLAVAPAAAVDVLQPCTSGSASNSAVCKDAASQNNTNQNPIVNAFKDVIQVIVIIIGALSVIMIMVGAVQLITSAGGDQASAKARHTIMYALIGLAVAVSAQLIIAFALNHL